MAGPSSLSTVLTPRVGADSMLQRGLLALTVLPILMQEMAFLL